MCQCPIGTCGTSTVHSFSVPSAPMHNAVCASVSQVARQSFTGNAVQRVPLSSICNPDDFSPALHCIALYYWPALCARYYWPALGCPLYKDIHFVPSLPRRAQWCPVLLTCTQCPVQLTCTWVPFLLRLALRKWWFFLALQMITHHCHGQLFYKSPIKRCIFLSTMVYRFLESSSRFQAKCLIRVSLRTMFVELWKCPRKNIF